MNEEHPSKNRFAASLDAFKLHQPAPHPGLPATTCPAATSTAAAHSASASPSSASGSSATFDVEFSVPSTARSRPPANGLHGRRSSMLAHSHVEADELAASAGTSEDDDEDAVMDSGRSESPEKLQSQQQLPYKNSASLLPPPAMFGTTKSSRRGMSASPGSPRTSPIALQDMSVADKSFNPLNPSNSKPQQQPLGTGATMSAARLPTPPPVEASFTTPMFTSSPYGSSLSARPTGGLARSKTSPTLRRPRAASPSASSTYSESRKPSRERAMTPEETSSGGMMEDSAVDRTAEEFQSSFDALGMSLPGEEEALPSPISRGPVRRPVQRRGSLMPKSKQHLRVAQQLEDEGTDSGVDEVLSEAALHRLNSSRPSVSVPSAFPTTSKAFLPPVASGTLPNPSSYPPPTAHTTNRFPESAAEDDGAAAGSSPDSDNDEMASMTQFEMEEDLTGTSMSEAESESKKSKEAWFGFREKPAATAGNGIPPGSASVASTPARANNSSGSQSNLSNTATVSRPGKRKMTSDERFEPFNTSSFKRRAVSPSASISPGLASPTLSQGSGSFSTHCQQLPSYQPGATSFSPRSYSRGGSPAPSSNQAAKEKLYATGDAAALGLFLAQRLGSGGSSSNGKEEEDLAKEMDMGL